MGRQFQTRDCEEARPDNRAHLLVCRCQKLHQALCQATEAPQISDELHAYRAAFAALFPFLEQDLRNIVLHWLYGTIDPNVLAEQNEILVIRNLIETQVLNVFASLVYMLPGLPIEGEPDVRERLLSLARRNLYMSLSKKERERQEEARPPLKPHPNPS